MFEALDFEGPLRLLGGSGAHWPDLSDVLLAGERVAFLDSARVKTSRFPRVSRWHVIVTDRRLICLRKSRRAARQQLHIPLNRIDQAFQRGLLGRRVVIRTARGTLRINGLGSGSGGQLVSLIVAAIRGDRPGPAQLAAMPGAAALLSPAQAAEQEAMLTRMEELEAQVDRLTQQMRFLEELMQAKRG